MHRTLERQLHHLSLEHLAKENAEFLEAISKTYEDFDAERKLMERSLDVSSEELAQVITLLRATLDSVDEGILVFDRKGTIVNHNKRFTEIWELPESVMIKDSQQKLVAMSELVIDRPAFEEIFFGTDPLESEVFVSRIIKLKSGKILDTYTNPQIVKGKKNGKVRIFRDITRHFLAEEDLKQKIDAMERLNKAMVDREIKMIELKDKIKQLEAQRGKESTNPVS